MSKIITLKTKPTLITGFSGWGGLSKGFELAGYKELLAIDNDKHSRKCFELNFPDVPVVDWDITTLKAKQILDFTSMKRGEVDTVAMTPPCQGISSAGKFDPTDIRNKLSFKAIELINEIQPKTFLFENVSGIEKGRMFAFLMILLSLLDKTNYTYEYRILNTLHYGVPQSRLRFIIIGVRKDLGIAPAFPEPDLIGAENLRVKDVTPAIHFFTQGYKSNYKIKSADNFMGTITKTQNVWAFTDGVMRDISTSELLKLCSYPDDWKYTGSKYQIWARAGNSVMPKFAEALANTIKSEILDVHYNNINLKKAA
jgi:DNA (cytosine-5)-methyltransferase 1